VEFERFVPYTLDLKLLSQQQLTLVSEPVEKNVQKTKIGFFEFWNEVVEEGGKQIVIDDEFLIYMQMTKGETQYSLQRNMWSSLLETFIQLHQKGVNFRYCWWFYIETDSVDVDTFDEFFLYDGGKVVDERVLLEHHDVSRLPTTPLKIEEHVNSIKQGEYRSAMIKAAYEEFETNTHSGRLHHLKNRANAETNCFGRPLDLIDQETSFISRFNTGQLLKELRTIRWLAIAITILLILILILK
jgi:hypothetical protein